MRSPRRGYRNRFQKTCLDKIALRYYMRTTLVKIGKDVGVRLPKEIAEEAQLGTELDLEVVDNAVIIRTAVSSRSGWSQAAAACHDAGEDCLGDWEVATGDQWDNIQ